MRGDNHRIISFRRANQIEEQAYEKANAPQNALNYGQMRPEMRPLTDEEGEVRELTEDDFKGMCPLARLIPAWWS